MTDAAPPLRQLPVSIEAEQALLGCILLNNEVLDKVERIVKIEHFSEEVHKRIFECMVNLIAAGKIATPKIMLTFLGDYDLGEGRTMGRYLASCAVNAPVPLNAPDFAQMIADLYARRQIIMACDAAVEYASNPAVSVSPSSVASKVIEELDALVQNADTRNYRATIAAYATRSLIDLQDSLAGKGVPITKTGILALDNKIGGLQAGKVIVIAGRPGMGKSALATEIMLNVTFADRNAAMCFFSLEMPGQEVANRMLSSIVHRAGGGAINYEKIERRSDLTDAEIERLWEAGALLKGRPVEIDAQPGLALSQIAARARRARQRFEGVGKRLVAVFIDHVQIVKGSAWHRGNRYAEMEEITAGLKVLAKELECCVIPLSQLSREIERRPIEERRPQMHDLRGSGTIEQDADIILGLFREAYYLLNEPARDEKQEARLNTVRNDLEIGVMKNRGGKTGTARAKIYIGSNRIADVIEVDEPEQEAMF